MSESNAISVPCPKCRAVAHSACAMPTGQRMTGFHAERVTARRRRDDELAEKARRENDVETKGIRAIVVCGYADKVYQTSFAPKLEEHGVSVVRVVTPEKLEDLRATNGASHLVLISIPHDYKSRALKFSQQHALTQISLPPRTSHWKETLGMPTRAPSSSAPPPMPTTDDGDEMRPLWEEENERLKKELTAALAGLEACQRELAQAKDDLTVAKRQEEKANGSLKEAQRENGELQLEITRMEKDHQDALDKKERALQRRQMEAEQARMTLGNPQELRDLVDFVRLGISTKQMTVAEGFSRILDRIGGS